jgi:hypothetical protein
MKNQEEYPRSIAMLFNTLTYLVYLCRLLMQKQIRALHKIYFQTYQHYYKYLPVLPKYQPYNIFYVFLPSSHFLHSTPWRSFILLRQFSRFSLGIPSIMRQNNWASFCKTTQPKRLTTIMISFIRV